MIKNESLINTVIREGHQKTFYHHGLKCQIVRNWAGAWCGYVYKKKGFVFSPPYYVHGGISLETDEMIGFDCGHINMDLVPFLYSDLPHAEKLKSITEKYFKRTIYRTKEYAIYHTKKLADQIFFEQRQINRLFKLKK